MHSKPINLKVVYLFFLCLCMTGLTPLAVIAKPQYSKPAPIGDPAAWFPAEAYPADALAAGVEGKVTVRLMIDVQGRPKSCATVESVGSLSLDKKTCELAVLNGRFTPATNTSGVPFQSSALLQVFWSIPTDMDNKEGRRQIADYVLEIDVDERGIARTCKTVKHASEKRDPCEQFKTGKFYGYYIGKSGEAAPAKFTVTHTEYVDPK